MKFYKIVIIAMFSHLAFGAICIYVYDSFRIDNTSLLTQQIKTIQAEKEISAKEKESILENIATLNEIGEEQRSEINFLMGKIADMERTIEVKQVELDSLIAMDSTKVVKLYRIALENLGIIPNMGERLTFREIGYGVKFLTKIPQLELKINLHNRAYNTLEALVTTREATIFDLESLNSAERRTNEQSELQSDLYKSAYEHATRFWANRIVFSVGGTGVYVSGVFHFGVGATLGIRLWSNE